MTTEPNERSQSTEALAERQRLNESRGERDLIAWIAPDLNLEPGARWLDLGCGRGDLLLRLGDKAMPGGDLIGADISGGSLEALEDRAADRDLPIEAIEADMDHLMDASVHPHLTELDQITAVYALYYSEDAASLIDALRERLAPGGQITVVGPAPGNNVEWFGLLESAGFSVPEQILSVSEEFMSEEVAEAARRFDVSRQKTMTNTITISSAEELTTYWRSNIYHDDERDADVAQAIERWFSGRDAFPITKEIALISMEASP